MRHGTKDNMPRGLRPVKRIELSEKNFKWRVVLAITLLVVGLVAIGYAISGWLKTDSGWMTIEVSSSELHCGEDFIFTYYISSEGSAAKNEKKAVTALYSEASAKAYRLFDRYRDFEGTANIHTVNTHINQTLEVDQVLYDAFEILEKNQSRYLYFGALHSEYYNLFFGYEDSPASESYDPYTNEENAEFFRTLAEYAGDSEHIKLELLGDRKVRLKVSDEYLAFAEENGIEVFIDFFRMKNAFITDYLADTMIAGGYTYGSISSYDGYARNLDGRGNAYALNFFDLNGNELFIAAKMTYRGRKSVVAFRSYPMGNLDSYWFYESAVSGKIIPPYVDSDGFYRTSVDTMTAYSSELGCAEVAVRMMPLYVAEKLDTAELNELCDDGVYTLWEKNETIYYNDYGLVLEELYSDGTVKYQKSFAGNP